jgi:arabinofuranosyltransferase
MPLNSRHAAVIKRTVSVLIIGTVALAQLIWFAWVSDDAAITLRTVLNLTSGYGAVFNLGERVQAYTHPLWLLLLTFGQLLIGNIMTTTIVISCVTSFAVVMLVSQRIAVSIFTGYAAAAVLMLSKAYLDFSSSGLENPLSHLLVIIFVLLAVRTCEDRSLTTYTGLLCVNSLMYLSRPDLVLIGSPVLVYVTYVLRPRFSDLAYCAVIGTSPLVAWTLFSLIYYGFPFPNTAYAKLGTGIALMASINQGILYYKNSVTSDPLTLWTISIGILVGLFCKPIDRCLSLGVVIYLLYILRIGGDFMSGRFFTVPFVVAIVILARNGFKKPIVAFFLIGYGSYFFKTSVLKHETVANLGTNGIADERLFYYGRRNLMSWKRDYPHFENLWRTPQSGPLPTRVSQKCGGLGYTGLEGGPALHLIDYCGLADPLLSRLPSRPNQRVGHYHRVVPTNYEFSAFADRNMLIDEDIKSYYDDIRLVTRAPLFDYERLKSVARLMIQGSPDLSRWAKDMNIPKYTPDTYRTVDAERLTKARMEGKRWDDAASTIIPGAGLEIVFASSEKLAVLDIVLDGNDLYRIDYFDGSEFKPLFTLGPKDAPEMAQYIPTPNSYGMVGYRRAVPDGVPATTRIRITPELGDERYAVGHLFNRQP